jgi:hypothetical protein
MVALITRESADELGLEAAQEVTALVKATDVMIRTGRGRHLLTGGYSGASSGSDVVNQKYHAVHPL